MSPDELIILIAEDSEDDAILLRRALKKAGIENPVRIVPDGEQVIQYMEGLNEYSNRAEHPLPALVILDIKMPKLNGFEVLQWICAHPQFKVVPTVIYSSSAQDSDVCKAFASGAHGYFVKPVGAENTVNIFRTIREYWDVSLKPDPVKCHEMLNAEA